MFFFRNETQEKSNLNSGVERRESSSIFENFIRNLGNIGKEGFEYAF